MSDHAEHFATDSQGHSAQDEAQEVWLMLEGLDMLEKDDEGDAGQAIHPQECDWCGEASTSGFFVATRERNFRVCPICWGRAPAYMDFLREGVSHEEARRRLTGY